MESSPAMSPANLLGFFFFFGVGDSNGDGGSARVAWPPMLLKIVVEEADAARHST